MDIKLKNETMEYIVNHIDETKVIDEDFLTNLLEGLGCEISGLVTEIEDEGKNTEDNIAYLKILDSISDDLNDNINYLDYNKLNNEIIKHRL